MNLISKVNRNFFCILFIFNYLLTEEKKIELPFKLGLENISTRLLQKLNNKQTNKKLRIGLITNQTGIDQHGKRNLDILLSKGLLIKSIFAPEHGFAGNVSAGDSVKNTKDKKTKIPIISLYDGDSKFKNFSRDDIKDIDVFIFDIQDSGMRHYTYISILYKMMELAAQHNKIFIVLDRPNPLGVVMQGPIVENEFISFVSIAPIPIRHAMTVGELAKYFNKLKLRNLVRLFVVPMQSYKRTRGLKKLPVFLSPKINSLDSCLNYSFLGILGEISPFNVSTNDKNFFKCILLPKAININMNQWDRFIELLKKQNITATFFSTIYPSNGKRVNGVKIKINDINKFDSMNTLILILEYFKKLNVKYNFAKIFDKVMGTAQFREFISDNFSKKMFIDKANLDVKKFFIRVKDLLIYQPLPKIIELKY